MRGSARQNLFVHHPEDVCARRATRGGQAPPSLIKGGHASPLRSFVPCRGAARNDEVHPVLQFSDSRILTLRKFKSSYRKIKKIIER